MSDCHLILDYVAMTEKFGPLDFEEFRRLWLEATALAEETPEEMRETILASIGEAAGVV